MTPPSPGCWGSHPGLSPLHDVTFRKGSAWHRTTGGGWNWLPSGGDASDHLWACLRAVGRKRGPRGAGRHRPPPLQTPLPKLLPSRCRRGSADSCRTPAEWPSTTTGSPCRSGCVPTPGWQSARPSASASIPTAPSLASPQPSLGSTVATPAELSVRVALADQANDDGGLLAHCGQNQSPHPAG
jgi:hypothetical protein